MNTVITLGCVGFTILVCDLVYFFRDVKNFGTTKLFPCPDEDLIPDLHEDKVLFVLLRHVPSRRAINKIAKNLKGIQGRVFHRDPEEVHFTTLPHKIYFAKTFLIENRDDVPVVKKVVEKAFQHLLCEEPILE